MNIYLDLDDTLIHAKRACSGNAGKRTPVKIIDKGGLGHETYYSLLRPKAQEILSFCRNLTQVRMLTTATRDYALMHNKTFSLGFSPKDIIAREDYLSYSCVGHGESPIATKLGVDPTSLLIDNLPRVTESSVLKQQYLGINQDKYIQIREFSGKDPTCFDQELQTIFKILEETIKNVPRVSKPLTYPTQEMPY